MNMRGGHIHKSDILQSKLDSLKIQNQMRTTSGAQYHYDALRSSSPSAHSPHMVMNILRDESNNITQKGAVTRPEYHSNLEKYQRLTQLQNEK